MSISGALAVAVFSALIAVVPGNRDVFFWILSSIVALGLLNIVAPVIARLAGWPRLEVWEDRVRYTSLYGTRKVVDLGAVGKATMIHGNDKALGFHGRALDQIARDKSLPYAACFERELSTYGLEAPVKEIAATIEAVRRQKRICR
jgi:hypothetical protein